MAYFYKINHYNSVQGRLYLLQGWFIMAGNLPQRQLERLRMSDARLQVDWGRLSIACAWLSTSREWLQITHHRLTVGVGRLSTTCALLTELKERSTHAGNLSTTPRNHPPTICAWLSIAGDYPWALREWLSGFVQFPIMYGKCAWGVVDYLQDKLNH